MIHFKLLPDFIIFMDKKQTSINILILLSANFSNSTFSPNYVNFKYKKNYKPNKL